MTSIVDIHPVNPEKRYIRIIAEALRRDRVIIIPTDSGYSLGCSAMSKKAVRKVYQLKRPAKKYNMSLIFQHFSPISEFAKLDNAAFRFMKPLVPGPYTFILPATNRGRKLLEVKRHEMGVRFPDHPFLSALYLEFPDPLLTTSARIFDDEICDNPEEIARVFGPRVDMIFSCGIIPQKPTTIINLTTSEPLLVRQGAGEAGF